VEGSIRGREGLESSGGGDCREWVQSGYQESEWEDGTGATAAGGAGGVDSGQGREDYADHGRDQRAAGGEEMNVDDFADNFCEIPVEMQIGAEGKEWR